MVWVIEDSRSERTFRKFKCIITFRGQAREEQVRLVSSNKVQAVLSQICDSDSTVLCMSVKKVKVQSNTVQDISYSGRV